MKKLSIDTLNAYPTVNQEHLMELKGGVLPAWVGWVVAGSTVAGAVAAIYQAIISGNTPETPSSPPPQLSPQQMADLAERLAHMGVSVDSITPNGVYGITPLFYGNGSDQSSWQGLPYRK